VTAPARPRRRAPVAALTLAVLALLLPGSAAVGADGATDCDDEAAVRRVEVRASLAGDGEVTQVERERTVETAAGDACHDLDDTGPAEELPVAVGVLHRGDAEGALEPGELGDAEGRVVTRVAVRDRTAASRTFEADTPEGTVEVTRDVAVPQLVRVELTYPAGWSAITPDGTGTRTDVIDGGIRVGRTALLFPPVTGDEVVLAVGAVPGGGVPEVAVAVTPVGDREVARLAGGDLDRDATAVVAALTELGADGAEQLADGTRDLAGGLGELADGTGQLAGGLGEAAAGSAELAAGADGLAAGTGDLAAGTSQLADGLRPLADGSRQVADGNRQLADQLGATAAGATQLADGADQLADGNAELAAGSRQLADGIAELAAGTRDLSAGATELRGQLAGLPDLGPVTELIVGPIDELLVGVTRLGDVLDQLTAGADDLAAGTEGLASGHREHASGTRELAGGLETAAAGTAQLADGADQVAGGTEAAADGAGELAGGTQELAAAASALAGGVGATAEGLTQVAGAGGQLADGADEAAAGAGALADGADELPDALREATGTADRAGARQAEERAVVAEGRRRAEEVVAAAAGGAPTGVLSTRLVAAGSQPLPWVPIGLAAALAIAAATGGRWWWTRRAGGAT
jgi:X-X-X-Leu-X-X-Gly heptad repeat protein